MPPPPPIAEPLVVQFGLHRWQGLRLQGPVGPVEMETCEVHDAALTLVPGPDGWRMAGLRARQVRITGLQGRIARPAGAGTGLAGRQLHLQALQGLQGSLRAFVTDAAWILDAAITLPLRAGTVEFDQVQVEHLGPDSAMGISGGGLYIDAPHMARRFLYVFTGLLPSGIEPEQRRGRGMQARGRVNVPQLLHGLLQAGEAPGQWANREAEAAMARSRVGGELQLGDGPLGVDGVQLDLSGHALGANRISLAAPALSGDLVLRWPHLSAAGARLALAGLQGGCGRIDGQLQLGLSQWWPRREGPPAAPVATVQAASLSLRDLHLAA